VLIYLKNDQATASCLYQDKDLFCCFPVHHIVEMLFLENKTELFHTVSCFYKSQVTPD